MTLEQIVATHPCPIIRGKIMENVDASKPYEDLEDLIFDSFIWGNTPQGWDFWSKVASNITDGITAPYSALKHLDLSYVPEPAKQPVMWRKIDSNDIPENIVLCANSDKTQIVVNRITINHLDGTIQSHNRREYFEVTHYILLSDLVNLPQERESP